MAIAETDLSRIIIERLEAHYPAPAIFAADEIAEWPDHVLPGLEAFTLFQSAERAEVLLCDGCHWNCSKPVVFRKQKAGARAFIVCDEEPDLGRIGVPIERLRQYRVTLSLLAVFLRGSFELVSRAPLSGPPPLLLGRVNGRHGEQSVSLLLHDGSIVLQIGAHSKSVVEFLAFRQGRITANRALLKKLADRKHGAGAARPRYQPDREKQRKQAGETARRDRAILAEALRVQGEIGRNFRDVSRELAASCRFRETRLGRRPLSPQRIYRIIYDQLEKVGGNFSAQITRPQPTD